MKNNIYEDVEPMLTELELELSEDLLGLEAEGEKPRPRPGYKAYTTSPEYRLQLFLDSLDEERRHRA